MSPGVPTHLDMNASSEAAGPDDSWEVPEPLDCFQPRNGVPGMKRKSFERHLASIHDVSAVV
jgi:hypothetical protein